MESKWWKIYKLCGSYMVVDGPFEDATSLDSIPTHNPREFVKDDCGQDLSFETYLQAVDWVNNAEQEHISALARRLAANTLYGAYVTNDWGSVATHVGGFHNISGGSDE